MKLRNFLVMGILYFLSACTESSVEPKSKTILESLSSFEVSTAAQPQLLQTIANAAYQSPNSAYGMSAKIDFRINDIEQTIDVFWLENNGKRHISRISLTDKSLIEEINLPTKVQQGRFLGFESLGNDRFIVGYSKANSFGQNDAEAWYTAFDKTGSEIFSTRIWGEQNQDDVDSKGSPAQAGSATITYNPSDNTIALYLAHTMRWSDNVRHQAGWFGFLDATTGNLLLKNNKPIGNGWFFSHNFDQRCFVSTAGKYYALAHGDSYPRALGISRWSATAGRELSLEYYKITNGKTGNNSTLTTTGDFVELSNTDVAVAYSTEDSRSRRDLRVALITGMNSSEASVASETWITQLSDAYVGWGSKIARHGDNLLVAWNTFSDKKALATHFTLLDPAGEVIGETETLDEAILYPAQSMRSTADGKRLIFVSAATGGLKVHMIEVE